jgi:hypothetical protein
MKTYNWDLTICNRADLLCDWEFVDKELIKEKCECVKKAMCLHIADLLKNWHRPEATEVLQNDK